MLAGSTNLLSSALHFSENHSMPRRGRTSTPGCLSGLEPFFLIKASLLSQPMIFFAVEGYSVQLNQASEICGIVVLGQWDHARLWKTQNSPGMISSFRCTHLIRNKRINQRTKSKKKLTSLVQPR